MFFFSYSCSLHIKKLSKSIKKFLFKIITVFSLNSIDNSNLFSFFQFNTDDNDNQEYVISYEKLNEVTNKLARVFQKLEKPEGTSKSFVAVCMKPSHQLPTVLIAILKAGMAYLPLDAEFPMTRMKHILEEAKPFVVVIEQEGKCEIFLL